MLWKADLKFECISMEYCDFYPQLCVALCDILLKTFCLYCLRLDVDECRTGAHSCQQTCLNQIGSYRCACRNGYQLASDGKHCNGMFLMILLSHMLVT